eukprot:m.67748 g.67748  ORF g.67748 m.67748 type:complete len:276 (+) comp11912_c0_seq3:1454-2281(+)
MASYDINLKTIDVEIAAKDVFGEGFPSETIRLQLDNYVPGLIMVSSFVLYWFILLPVVFPATKPTSKTAIYITEVWRDWHNFVLFIYSGIACGSTFYYVYQNSEFSNMSDLLCRPIEGTWMRPLSITFTISKIIEWLDTAFIVWLGNRPPMFLHVYHHATTFWLFMLTTNIPGTEKLGMLLNGGVHTMMYSHYWRSWPKKLVPLITTLQIVQLATVTYVWSIIPMECPRYENILQEYPIEFMTPYAMVPVFLYYFVTYFINRFIKKKEKKQTKKE